MGRMVIMEHNPLASFNDGLEITYSDLKKNDDGEYIVLYFEKPNDKKSGFDSARFIYPGSDFSDVNGFSQSDLEKLLVHVNRMAPLALQFSKEDRNASV